MLCTPFGILAATTGGVDGVARRLVERVSPQTALCDSVIESCNSYQRGWLREGNSALSHHAVHLATNSMCGYLPGHGGIRVECQSRGASAVILELKSR